MNTFMTGTDIYERISLRENEFEAVVMQFWHRIAPRWSLCPWKPLVEGPAGRARPDAVALTNTLDQWTVVEIELASHPESHFRNQFEVLQAASYGLHLLDGLTGLINGASREVISGLVSTQPPSFLCVADESSQKIVDACRDYGFELAVLTPHRSRLGDYALRIARIPKVYRLDDSYHHSYQLLIGEESWGGRLMAYLPANFPRYPSILVRHSDTMAEVRVITGSGKRMIFLPYSYVQAGGIPPRLTAIDPVMRKYELS